MSLALLAVAAAFGIGTIIHPWLGIENVDLVFLAAIVAIAFRYGLLPSILASIAASLTYNFFFLPPTYTFTIADPKNVAAFVFFTIGRDRNLERGRAGAQPVRHGAPARWRS